MHIKRALLALFWGALAGSGVTAHGQSADALIEKLVTKGILTKEEAKELREEANKGFTQAYQSKAGMPDWLTSFKISGDFRARYDGLFNPQLDPGAPAGTPPIDDRHRFRYRLRVGAVATMRDDFEVGFKLTSAENNSGLGGDPLSANTTFADNGAKKFIFIDQAYAKWTGLKTPALTGSLIVGKLENPF